MAKLLAKNGQIITKDGVAFEAPEGITPAGTVNITANGSYDVTQFANALVNVAGSSANAIFVEFTPNSGNHSCTINVPNASNYTNFAFILTGALTSATASVAVLKIAGTIYSMRFNNATMHIVDGGEITINENSVYIYSYYSANFIVGQKHALIGW